MVCQGCQGWSGAFSGVKGWSGESGQARGFQGSQGVGIRVELRLKRGGPYWNMVRGPNWTHVRFAILTPIEQTQLIDSSKSTYQMKDNLQQIHIHNSGLELIDCCRLQKSSRVAGKCYVRVLKNNISLWQTHTTTDKRQILCVMSELYNNYKNDKRDSPGITIAEKQLGVRVGTRSDLEHFPLQINCYLFCVIMTSLIHFFVLLCLEYILDIITVPFRCLAVSSTQHNNIPKKCLMSCSDYRVVIFYRKLE